MKSVMGLIGVSLLLTFSCYAQSVTRETRIDQYDVPDVVLKAFEIAYPNARTRSYTKVDANGALSYMIEAKEGDSHRFASYDPQGQLVRIEDVIATTSLPANAQTIIQRDYAEAEVISAAKFLERDRVSYRANVKNEGKLFTLLFDADGGLTSTHEVKVSMVFERAPGLRP
jgi:hypothetical protein